MPNPTVQSTIDAITNANSVDDSVLAYVTGVPALISAAVAAAIANGATADELAPLTQLSTDLTSKTAAIQAAIAANTPITPQQLKAKK